MKRLFFSLSLIIILINKGFAQTEKNTLLLGGYANIYLNTSDNSHLSINPNTGLFITDNFCLGISIPVIYQSDEMYWGLSPFCRYYFNKKESTSLYILGSIGVTSLSTSENIIGSELISLGLGHVWFLNSSVGFEAEIIGSTSFHDFTLGLSCGFQIYFNKQINTD